MANNGKHLLSNVIDSGLNVLNGLHQVLLGKVSNLLNAEKEKLNHIRDSAHVSIHHHLKMCHGEKSCLRCGDDATDKIEAICHEALEDVTHCTNDKVIMAENLISNVHLQLQGHLNDYQNDCNQQVNECSGGLKSFLCMSNLVNKFHLMLADHLHKANRIISAAQAELSDIIASLKTCELEYVNDASQKVLHIVDGVEKCVKRHDGKY